MGSRIQLAALQEDEEIIAVVDDHIAESVPAYIQRFLKERLVLSSDGNISLWSKHRWDESHLLKFWNVRDIESITKTDKFSIQILDLHVYRFDCGAYLLVRFHCNSTNNNHRV